MRIFEINPRALKKIGELEVDFDESNPCPRYVDGTMYLPGNPEDELFWLSRKKGEEQFVYRCEKSGASLSDQLSFCGIDDGQPFVAKINPEPYYGLKRAGPQGFYNSLRPSIFSRMESVYHAKGVKLKARRQGRLWAMPLPQDFPEILASYTLVTADTSISGTSSRVDVPFANTGHLITGSSILGMKIFGLDNSTLFKGIVKDSHGRKMNLDDAVHLLMLATNVERNSASP